MSIAKVINVGFVNREFKSIVSGPESRHWDLWSNWSARYM